MYQKLKRWTDRWDVLDLIQDILILHMKLTGAEKIILEQAHCSGQVRHGKRGDASLQDQSTLIFLIGWIRNMFLKEHQNH